MRSARMGCPRVARDNDRLVLKRDVASLVLLGYTEPSVYIFCIEKKIIVIELSASSGSLLGAVGSTKPSVDQKVDVGIVVG